MDESIVALQDLRSLAIHNVMYVCAVRQPQGNERSSWVLAESFSLKRVLGARPTILPIQYSTLNAAKVDE